MKKKKQSLPDAVEDGEESRLEGVLEHLVVFRGVNTKPDAMSLLLSYLQIGGEEKERGEERGESIEQSFLPPFIRPLV